MCRWGEYVKVQLHEPDPKAKQIAIVDRCLAPLVQMLNLCGIKTVASCCGHDGTFYSHVQIDSKNVEITRLPSGEFTVHLRLPYLEIQDPGYPKISHEHKS